MSSFAWTPCKKPEGDRRFMDMTERRFGQLVVGGYMGRDRRSKHYWWCGCRCGNFTTVLGEALRDGRVVSCGCWRDTRAGLASITHGATVGQHRTPEYRAWKGMRDRCLRAAPRNRAWNGRGIGVCQRWDDFAAFLADMGLRPSPEHSLERVNNDGDYEPGNCIWATRKVQCRNRRSTRLVFFRGEYRAASEVAELLGIKPMTLLGRLNAGWSDHDATTIPVEKQRGNKPRVGRPHQPAR